MIGIVPVESISIPQTRQRELFPEQEMADLKASILTEKGLMCPILVRPGAEEGKYFLVAGERRFRVISTFDQRYNFGDQEVEPGFIPIVVRNFSSDIEAMEAELHENIIRLNLSWREQAKAIAQLHELKKLHNPKQTIGQTAVEIDDSETTQKTGYATNTSIKKVQNSVLVAQFLDDPDVAKATSLRDATKIVSRKIEEEAMLKLKAYREEKQKEAEERLANGQPEIPDDTATLLDTLFTSSAKLLTGDIREQILLVPDNSINVIITDPPYGQGVEDFNEASAPVPHRYSEADYEELYDVLIANMDRVCSTSAHAYIFCDVEYFCELRDKVRAIGWYARRTPLIWAKQRGVLSDGGPSGYKKTHEYVLFATRGQRPCARVANDVIFIPPVVKTFHAAQKPVELYEYFLDMSSVPGDTVLDAFAGSGTIFKATRTKALKAIGIEQEELSIELCNLAIQGRDPAWEPEL